MGTAPHPAPRRPPTPRPSARPVPPHPFRFHRPLPAHLNRALRPEPQERSQGPQDDQADQPQGTRQPPGSHNRAPFSHTLGGWRGAGGGGQDRKAGSGP